MSYLEIYKDRKEVVMHDTECPPWDQVSSNNTLTSKADLAFIVLQ